MEQTGRMRFRKSTADPAPIPYREVTPAEADGGWSLRTWPWRPRPEPADVDDREGDE